MIRNGYVDGGLMGPAPVQQAQPQAQPQGQPQSAEEQAIFQQAIMALDPSSNLSQEDRMQILQAFEEYFGPGSVEDLIATVESQKAQNSDGLSDSVPAEVSGQPTSLSEGEFIVPADAVSGLGNGSTEAGGRQLGRMVDGIRSARGGPQQPKQISPQNLIPGGLV